MDNGQLILIYITPSEGQLMQMIDQVNAVPGKGLVGDRYYSKTNARPDSQVTLIEIETIQALEKEGILLSPGETRRNLVTQGIALNNLVGKEFWVGRVRLRGHRLCEPCDYLAKMTQPEVLAALVHRGGLRAEIITEGVLKVGDTIIVE